MLFRTKQFTQKAKYQIFSSRYDMDRLVEDLIRESMERGEFTNIKGTGKPLKERTSYPYVDEVTRKINEVIISAIT